MLKLKLLILFFLLTSVPLFSNPLDSIRVEKMNGKLIVIHQIEQGETLFSLFRRYGASVEEIKKANPQMEVLKIGETLKIPIPAQPDPSAIKHTVAASETLYSISRTYGVEIAQLKSWNNLDDAGLSVGQVLLIHEVKKTVEPAETATLVNSGVQHEVAAGETLYSISRKFDVSIEELKEWNNLEDNALSLGQLIVVGKNESSIPTNENTEAETTSAVVTEESVTVISTDPKPQVTEQAEDVAKFDKIVENGLAEVIDGTENTRKYLALHKTAEIGTIMQVKNEMNGLSVFVRVLGKLPDTPENNMLILKLSEKAYQKLGALDKRFRVELVYSP